MAYDKVIDSSKLDADLTSVADAIRAKSGTTGGLAFPDGFVSAVEEIQTESSPIIQPLSITENGTYEAPDGVDGYSPVTVAIESGLGGDDGSFKAVIERTAVNPTLPSDLTSIGNNAFYGCSDLALTSLPDGVTRIGSSAFQNCTNLALTYLPDGLTSIGISAFSSCSNLALTSLPEGLTSIDIAAFGNCSDLALTYLPDGLSSIGNNAFLNCTNLALTYLPDGLTSIGNTAFRNCTNLTELTFKGKPSSISSSAFNGCTNLLTINVPWAEGEVANAPWGATNATINYNYVEEG